MGSLSADPMPDAAREADTVPRVESRRKIMQLRIVAVLAGGLTVAWATVALLTAGHGLSLSDEGFYLLLYRWWDTPTSPQFTGVHYIYGPVFELLGHNIAALRVFRLLTILAAHAAFGWAFMGWLRTRRPAAPATRWWEIAGAMILLAFGGILYSWLPLSPGYNDVSTLGGLVAGAIVLRLVTHVERGTSIPAWLPVALGSVAVVILLAKWSSAVSTFALLGVVGIIAVRRRSWREVGRVILWALGGLLLTALLMQLTWVPLTSVVPGLISLNKNVTGSTHSPTELLDLYYVYSVQALKVAAQTYAVLLIASVVATLAVGRISRRVSLVLALAGIALSVRQILESRSWEGGFGGWRPWQIAIIGLLLVPAVIGATALVRDRVTLLVRDGLAPWGADPARLSSLTRPGSRDWAVLVMLFMLPLTQAAGTATGLHGMAVNSLAAWGAAMLVILTGIEGAPAEARWLVRAVTAGLVTITASIAVTALWWNPYLTSGRSYTTATVSGVPALSGIKLDPATARAYSELRERLRPWTEPSGRAIIAYDQIAGLVLALDGRPVGEAWVGAGDPVRTAVSIRAECQRPNRWWGGRAPILLFNRPVTELEIATLRDCGYEFATDYRQLTPPVEVPSGIEVPHGLQVYVPVNG